MSNTLEEQIILLLGEIESSESGTSVRQSLLYKLGDLLKEHSTPSELLQETLARLFINAQDRWEWRDLWQAYSAVLDSSLDYSAIFKNKTVDVKDSAEFVFNICVELTAILWQELAIHKLITFYYIQDTDDGDHFGPEDFSFEETAAEYVLSPGYFVDWVIRHEYLNSEHIAERLEEEWGSWDAAIDKTGALEHGASIGHLEPITAEAFGDIFNELGSIGDMETQFIITDVEPDYSKIKKNLENSNFEGLSDPLKHELVVHLIETIKHPLLGGFKVSQHLLRLLMIHPATPEESKAHIYLASSQLI